MAAGPVPSQWPTRIFAMIAYDNAAASVCTSERPAGEHRVFDETPGFCPRAVEILTTLRDVFDSLGATPEGAALATAEGR
jgi:hypothetical protein